MMDTKELQENIAKFKEIEDKHGVGNMLSDIMSCVSKEEIKFVKQQNEQIEQAVYEQVCLLEGRELDKCEFDELFTKHGTALSSELSDTLRYKNITIVTYIQTKPELLWNNDHLGGSFRCKFNVYKHEVGQLRKVK